MKSLQKTTEKGHAGSGHDLCCWWSSALFWCSDAAGKAFVPKKRVDPIMESVTLEPELEEALSSATDAELCDIAGIFSLKLKLF